MGRTTRTKITTAKETKQNKTKLKKTKNKSKGRVVTDLCIAGRSPGARQQMLNLHMKHKIAHKIWSIICLYTPDSKRYPNMQAMCMRYMVQKCKDTFGLEVVQGGGKSFLKSR